MGGLHVPQRVVCYAGVEEEEAWSVVLLVGGCCFCGGVGGGEVELPEELPFWDGEVACALHFGFRC